MKDKFKRLLLIFILNTLFYGIIAISWRIYEIKTIGYVDVNTFDTIIAMILTISLVINVLLYKDYIQLYKQKNITKVVVCKNEEELMEEVKKLFFNK